MGHPTGDPWKGTMLKDMMVISNLEMFTWNWFHAIEGVGFTCSMMIFSRIFPAFPPNWLEKNPAGQLWQPRQPADRWTENTSWEQHTLNGEAGGWFNFKINRPVCFLIFLDFLSFSRRWFQICCFVFTPILGEMIQFDKYVSDGWFNQHLDIFFIHRGATKFQVFFLIKTSTRSQLQSIEPAEKIPQDGRYPGGFKHFWCLTLFAEMIQFD